MPREDRARQPLCADIEGFSLHAAARVEAHDRQQLEQRAAAGVPGDHFEVTAVSASLTATQSLHRDATNKGDARQ